MSALLSVLIPAYNESERIAATVSTVRLAFPTAQIVVIDDGSQDDTANRAEAAGADIVLRQKNLGKGAALRAGLAHVNGDILLLLDADLAASAHEATRLVTPIQEGLADMTIATFPRHADLPAETSSQNAPPPPRKGGGMGMVVRLARFGIRRMTGRMMVAPLSGQRCIRKATLDGSGGFADGWGVEVALTIRALRAGYRVEEIPTRMSHRVTGRSWKDIRHRAAQFFAVVRILAQLWIDLRSKKRGAEHGRNTG